jgi:hypothetical protein
MAGSETPVVGARFIAPGGFASVEQDGGRGQADGGEDVAFRPVAACGGDAAMSP